MRVIDKQTVGEPGPPPLRPATTPLRWALESGQVDPNKIQELVALYTTASPLTLKRQIAHRLAALGVFHSA